jgi:hypothetical protein
MRILLRKLAQLFECKSREMAFDDSQEVIDATDSEFASALGCRRSQQFKQVSFLIGRFPIVHIPERIRLRKKLKKCSANSGTRLV